MTPDLRSLLVRLLTEWDGDGPAADLKPLFDELRDTAVWLTTRADVLRKLADNSGAFRVNPTGVGMRQALRDEAARLDGRAQVIRQTILKATGA